MMKLSIVWVFIVWLWSTATVPANATPVTALAFSPDGSVLVSNGSRCIEVRSPKDGSAQKRIPCDLAKITSIAFHPLGQLLVVTGGVPGVRGEVLLLDWREQKILRNLTNYTDLVTSVAFNADGSLLGIASADHLAHVWRVAEDGSQLAEVFTLAGHAAPVLAIAFSPTGRSLVTASADRSLKVWSTQDGHLLRTFNHHTEAVHALAFRPRPGGVSAETPAFCASAGDDRTVRIWQPEVGRMVRIIRQHQGPILVLGFSLDGKMLFSAGKEGRIRRIDADSDVILAEWPAHSDWIYAMAISPDGSKLASGDWSGAVRLWDVHKAGPATASPEK
jgi:WD40 repeat protein